MAVVGREGVLLPEYYESAQGCEQCEYKLRPNSPAQKQVKEDVLQRMLYETAKRPLNVTSMLTDEMKGVIAKKTDMGLDRISEDGLFSDLDDNAPGALSAVQRLAWISQQYHWYLGRPWSSDEEKEKFLKAIAHYCKIEADREDLGRTRFHSSIFCFPKCAVQLFHALLPDFLAVETGERQDETTKEARIQLLRIGMQAWTLPQRGDHTDRHPISPERFRKHVWWVGANAICYRPLFQVALLFRSAEMMDTLMFVASRILTPVSAATVEDAFWSEGICADGFGWGHGRQTYNTGYPTQGIISGLEIMAALTGSPWETEMKQLDFSWLFHYMRGITWGDYKGWRAPMQSRHIFKKNSSENIDALFSGTDYALEIAQLLKQHFYHLLTKEQQRETDAFLTCGHAGSPKYPAGWYEGIRYFWNNDDLICKNDAFYLFVNMASSRCDGVESACDMADKRNSFLTDGSYVIARRGDEYRRALGTWQMGMLPGITSRELTNQEIEPETNWRGYHSKYNLAGGVASGEYGAAGFVFEKKRTEEPEAEDTYSKEMMGVQAYKSYFIMKDSVVCLGAGITDLKPEYGKPVRTTVNHTGLLGEAEELNEQGNVTGIIHGKNILQLDRARYIRQDGILYGILAAKGQSAQMKVCAEDRMSEWKALSAGNALQQEETVPVFELAILHGEEVKDGDYAYFMYCGDEGPAEYLKDIPFRVLQNDRTCQAVENKSGGLLEAVLYEPGVKCLGTAYTVQVNAPTALLLEKMEHGFSLTVCDLEQSPERIELQAEIRQRQGGGKWTVIIPLPGGSEVGKPVTVEFS